MSETKGSESKFDDDKATARDDSKELNKNYAELKPSNSAVMDKVREFCMSNDLEKGTNYP